VASIGLLFVTEFVELQTRSCAEFPTEKVGTAPAAVSAWLQSSVDLPNSPSAGPRWPAYWRRRRLGLQLNEHIAEPGDVVFHHACKLGLEGVVSKRLGSR
jgi:hypothetical protein